MFENIMKKEKALLIGVECTDWEQEKSSLSIEDSLEELSLLAKTAGVEVLEMVKQKLPHPDMATYIGKGKVEEVKIICREKDLNLIITDTELSLVQQRNLEDKLEGLKVIDRTTLILDIFAQRAKSNEGVVQVELAQQKYLLPRIRGQGLVLSRLGGGIGTRGPGETKLEVDKRAIRLRIRQLEKELKIIKSQRVLVRNQRKSKGVLTAALVGYTNAGKSTLLNALTKADVLVEDKLFATLDITTRKLDLPQGRKILLSDTVGFINKLPHTLVAAFRSTLEETLYADVLLHIVDASNLLYKEQMHAVFETLKVLKAEHIPIITVYNKADLLSLEQEQVIKEEIKVQESSLLLSALKINSIEQLLLKLEEFFNNRASLIKILLPYDKGFMLERIYEIAKVEKKDYQENGILLELFIANEWFSYIEEYILKV